MSVELAQHTEHGHEEHLSHQFEDRAQQDESYVVGMWTFLVTEIMFFGGLFLAYLIYRFQNPAIFRDAHEHLEVTLGAINTVVLLTSSFFMALAVRSAQLKQRRGQLFWLGLTVLCAFLFLGIKSVEYYRKWEHHLVPGPSFRYEVHGREVSGMDVPEQPFRQDLGRPVKPMGMTDTAMQSPDSAHEFANRAQMFFNLYFAMTGLHGIHVIIGIIVMGILMVMIWRRHPATEYYMPVEMAGLYWHFVDIVWIFLFPLFYLIPKG